MTASPTTMPRHASIAHRPFMISFSRKRSRPKASFHGAITELAAYLSGALMQSTVLTQIMDIEHVMQVWQSLIRFQNNIDRQGAMQEHALHRKVLNLNTKDAACCPISKGMGINIEHSCASSSKSTRYLYAPTTSPLTL